MGLRKGQDTAHLKTRKRSTQSILRLGKWNGFSTIYILNADPQKPVRDTVGSGQPDLVGGVPAPWQGGWNEMVSEVLSNTSHSMNLIEAEFVNCDLVKAILVCWGYNRSSSCNSTAAHSAPSGSASELFNMEHFFSVRFKILFQMILLHWYKQDQAICHHVSYQNTTWMAVQISNPISLETKCLSSSSVTL